MKTAYRKRVFEACIMILGIFFISGTAWGDFYVIAAGGGVGTRITSLPYTISSPGFYYIKDNLAATGTGITVNADNVTIDLMGFTISGPGILSGSNYGIYISAQNNVEIRNGTIRGFGSHGIYESATGVNSHRVIGIRALSNGGNGIELGGPGHLVKDCTASQNNGSGIVVDRATTVTGNTCYDNEDDGIRTVHGCTVIGNTVMSNGHDGIEVNFGCTIKNNTVWYNRDYGIAIGSNCLIHSNTVHQNNLSLESFTNIEECDSCTIDTNEN